MNITGFDVDIVGLYSGFKLNRNTDFELVLRLSADGGLPVLSLKIYIPLISNILQIRKGNKIDILLEDSTIPFEIINIKTDGAVVDLLALYDNVDYIRVRRQSSHPQVPGTQAVFNVTQSSDIRVNSTESQTWLQTGQTDKEFVIDTLLRCDYNGEVPFLYYSPYTGLRVSTYDYEKTQNNVHKLGRSRGEISFKYDIVSLPYLYAQAPISQIGVSSSDLSTNYSDADNSGAIGNSIINSGNVHDSYYSSLINNIQALSRIEEQLLKIDIARPSFIIEPGSPVIFSSFGNVDGESIPDLVGQSKLVTTTEFNITSKRVAMTLFVPRFS